MTAVFEKVDWIKNTRNNHLL